MASHESARSGGEGRGRATCGAIDGDPHGARSRASPPAAWRILAKPFGLVLPVGLSLFAAIAVAAPGQVLDPGCGEIDVVMRADVVIYPLARSFIRAGTDSAVLRDQPWRRGVDYVLDGLRGELRLLR